MSPLLLKLLLRELGCPQGPGQGLCQCHRVTMPLVPTRSAPSHLHKVQLLKERSALHVAGRMRRKGVTEG